MPCRTAGVSAVARYIELNPVRAGICGHAAEYPWSSAGASCSGKNGQNGFAPIMAPGGTWSEYLEYEPSLERLDRLKRIRESVRTGRPFAREHYLEVIEKKTGLNLKPQRKGRKPKIENQSGGTN